MSATVEYKCPCCGGAISFDSDVQKMVCPYCDTEFDADALSEFDSITDGTEENYHWDEYSKNSGNGDWKEDELDAMNVYVCSSCGGQIISDKNTSATTCPYCQSPIIITGRLTNEFRPDYLIPFKFNREQAKSALNNFMKKKLLLPKSYKDEAVIDKIEGVYVPFWLFDCDVHGDIKYRATKVTKWSDSEYFYKKTKYYLLTRKGDLSFEKVPSDGSVKMADNYMEAIEPYDYSEMIPFSMPYLSGYLADKYDVDPKAAQPRANDRVRKTTDKMFDSTTHGYTTCTRKSAKVDITKSTTSYALLPVWIMNSKYKDKTYTFAMNGQTGKFVGELPVSKKRFFAWLGGICTTLFAIGAGICSLVTFL